MTDKPLISFDYAIKYLLKNKGDYEIVAGFISALFAAQGYKPVKINSLLESESNKEEKDLKRSVADLVVEDTEGNKYIVEIERSFTTHFTHKACFNSSRLVVDSIESSQDYTQSISKSLAGSQVVKSKERTPEYVTETESRRLTNQELERRRVYTSIKKIFYISLLYFSTKQMRKPIYHGKTIVHEIDTAHPASVRIANQGLVMFDNPNVFPEYFFIWVPLFNDVINQEIDEWLYVMKHSDTRADFKSPYMAKVAERLSVLKMTTAERNTYFNYLKEAVHSQDVLVAAELKGMEKGVAKGKAEGIRQVAINMLKRKKQDEEICQDTGYSADELDKLKREIS